MTSECWSQNKWPVLQIWPCVRQRFDFMLRSHMVSWTDGRRLWCLAQREPASIPLGAYMFWYRSTSANAGWVSLLYLERMSSMRAHWWVCSSKLWILFHWNYKIISVCDYIPVKTGLVLLVLLKTICLNHNT